jgi:hypothetical protein
LIDQRYFLSLMTAATTDSNFCIEARYNAGIKNKNRS